VRVLIADGQALVRAGFRVFLEDASLIRVVGEAATGDEALELARRMRPQVALVDEHGVQLANRNLPNDSAELVAILGRLAPGTPVAFEAAYGWGWLAELLDELSLEPHLVHPSRCKAIAAARLKDDRVDARTLAQLLRAELLPEAWIAPQAVRDQRGLLRHRAALVRVATALKCRVHAVLADRGVRVEEQLWGPGGRVFLADLALDGSTRHPIGLFDPGRFRSH